MGERLVNFKLVTEILLLPDRIVDLSDSDRVWNSTRASSEA